MASMSSVGPSTMNANREVSDLPSSQPCQQVEGSGFWTSQCFKDLTKSMPHDLMKTHTPDHIAVSRVHNLITQVT